MGHALCLMYRSPWRGNVRPRGRDPFGQFNSFAPSSSAEFPAPVRLVCCTQPRLTSCSGATTRRSVRITMPRHAGGKDEWVWVCTAPSRSPAVSEHPQHHLHTTASTIIHITTSTVFLSRTTLPKPWQYLHTLHPPTPSGHPFLASPAVVITQGNLSPPNVQLRLDS